ncbi:MAG: hypothetical protein KJ990_05745 [Proteobacteria bacterium]|nr:hypothetical protein [Pseudomonadota bacterium]MBU1648559.1 hypothetical protein [Pseudomonadota bacterium]MBU1986312.1 hypothetical protein [Pseudomonadota bacterium]
MNAAVLIGTGEIGNEYIRDRQLDVTPQLLKVLEGHPIFSAATYPSGYQLI